MFLSSVSRTRNVDGSSKLSGFCSMRRARHEKSQLVQVRKLLCGRCPKARAFSLWLGMAAGFVLSDFLFAGIGRRVEKKRSLRNRLNLLTRLIQVNSKRLPAKAWQSAHYTIPTAGIVSSFALLWERSAVHGLFKAKEALESGCIGWLVVDGWVMRVYKFHDVKAAFVDVKMDISLVEVWRCAAP